MHPQAQLPGEGDECPAHSSKGHGTLHLYLNPEGLSVCLSVCPLPAVTQDL